MSVLYCTIPHFAAMIAQRDDARLRDLPLVLIDPQRRVFSTSGEAAQYGIVTGLTAQAAEVRCPEARLVEADIARYRQEFETLLQILEIFSPTVEPHGWGAAYVDLGKLAQHASEAIALCGDVGRMVRQEIGEMLQPALGWNSSKFTAQAAARCTRPGHILPISSTKERPFLKPLPVRHLPLEAEALQRLGFLGLRTLGQYAALPSAAVWQQFGRAGKLAQRCARGQDDRPVVPRTQEQQLTASCEFENPLGGREQLLATLQQLVTPLLAKLRGRMSACGEVRLTVHFADHTTQERERVLLFPTAMKTRVMRAFEQLLDSIHWQAGAGGLKVTLERIQDALVEQLHLFPAENERERKLREVQQTLTARFGDYRLRRPVLALPGAPLPEWRVGWID